MDRLACASIPELPLQLLLTRHPDWADRPAVVVREEKPQSEILWSNAAARRAGVIPGMRYAQGLSLAAELRAGVISSDELTTEVASLATLLRRFTSELEVSTDEPGIFWLNAIGLSRLFSSASAWARAIHRSLADRGRRAAVVVGFRRFATYALARTGDGVCVFAQAKDEDKALRRVALASLAFAPATLATLTKLNVRTLGEFLALPAQGIRRRFGAEAARLYGLAAGTEHDPLVPTPAVEPIRYQILLDDGESNATALVFLVRRGLSPLLARLAQRGEALRELELNFVLDHADPRTDWLRPAEPTLDAKLILELVRLRLEGSPLPAPVDEITLIAHAATATPQQLQLFFEAARRDLAAADRALARVRAELGDDAVVHAQLKEGHLPEAHFTWEPLTHLPLSQPPGIAAPLLIRRLYAKPVPLGSRRRREPDGWIVRDLHSGSVVRTWGPYIVSGGWWRREVSRHYYYLETQHGHLFWVYYDPARRRWFLHGQVE
jgi:protein ImuB